MVIWRPKILARTLVLIRIWLGVAGDWLWLKLQDVRVDPTMPAAGYLSALAASQGCDSHYRIISSFCRSALPLNQFHISYNHKLSLEPNNTMSPTRLTVLISGTGSNLQALIDACASGFIPNAQIVRVISNKKDAKGLTKAETAGIPTLYHNLFAGGYIQKGEKDAGRKAAGREKYDADLAMKVLEDEPDLVVCVSRHQY